MSTIQVLSLEAFRKELHITQSSLATAIGVTRLTYSKWEKNPLLMPIGKYNQAQSYLNKELKRSLGSDKVDDKDLYRLGYQNGYQTARNKYIKQLSEQS